jgi:SHS2 domain-containing protein
MPGDFTILDHPSDIGIEARGRSLAETFEQAARGLMSVILDLATVDLREERQVEVRGTDYEQLLVKWLSEILYLYDGQQFVSSKFDVKQLNATGLKATVHGEPFSTRKHSTKLDVKAVTYHQLSVRENNDGAMVRVFLDI